VHVMMAVESPRSPPVETTELLELRRYDVLEGAAEAGVIDDHGKPVVAQVRGEFTLPLHQACGTVRRRKRRRKVEVQASIDPSSQSHRRRPLGILHKDHNAHRGDSAAKEALEGPIGSLVVTSPIVGVYNEHSNNLFIQRSRSDEP